jgi:hypothetical protein
VSTRRRTGRHHLTVGVTEHTCGVHNVQSLGNLAILCGNFGLESSGVNPLRGQNNVQGAGDMGSIPYDLPGYQKVQKEEVRLNWEKAWGVKLTDRVGITKVTAIEEILEGNIHSAYIMGENTVVSDANANKTRRALEALDFLVVQEIFLTETAKMADVVLPGSSFAETDGTFTNTDRRVQLVRKAVPPPGDARGLAHPDRTHRPHGLPSSTNTRPRSGPKPPPTPRSCEASPTSGSNARVASSGPVLTPTTRAPASCTPTSTPANRSPTSSPYPSRRPTRPR